MTSYHPATTGPEICQIFKQFLYGLKLLQAIFSTAPILGLNN